jgi:hypothetical protein
VVTAVALAPAPRPRGTSPGAGCITVSLPVVVNLNDTKHEALIAHEARAVHAGEARVLHLGRALADVHRSESLRGIPTRPGMDRDEYPPAFSWEGGIGADVAYVPASVNRSGGAMMANELRPFCDGQAFIIEATLPG